jgi:hypothetical protein
MNDAEPVERRRRRPPKRAGRRSTVGGCTLWMSETKPKQAGREGKPVSENRGRTTRRRKGRKFLLSLIPRVAGA